MPDTQNRLQMDAQVRLAPISSVDKQARTVDLVWTTGARVKRYDWQRDMYYMEELKVSADAIRMDRLQSGAPLLDTHGQWRLSDVIGVVEDAWVKNGEGGARVRFSNRDEVTPIFTDVKDGILRNVSVGYRIHKIERLPPDEQSAGLPVYRAIDWEPMEISLVPVGADAAAGTRSDNAKSYPCEFINHLPDAGIRGEAEMPENTQTPAAAPAATDEAVRAATEKAREEGARLERERQSEIRELCRGLNKADLADAMIARGITAEQAGKELLRALAKDSEQTTQRGSADITIGRDEVENRRQAMADAIFHRVRPATALAENARDYRYMSLTRLAEECIVRSGGNVRGLAPREIVERAMHTTSDFPLILANVMGKTLRAQYQENVPSYTRWARRAPNLPDFKARYVTQMANAPDLLQVNEAGEIKYGTFGEGRESYNLATFARGLSISRQAIINDDLSAFDRIPAAFAGAARRLENSLVYAQLTSNPTMGDSVALFHSTHANLAGTGTAISATSLGLARAAMRLQKGLQSEPLNLTPSYLLVPATQEQLAYQFTSSQFVPAKSTDVNEFRGGGRTALEPIVEALLDANSTTAWYLMAEGSQIDTVEYAYLDGGEGVYIDSSVDFDTDGMKVKARLDFVAKVIDYRGLYKNPGA